MAESVIIGRFVLGEDLMNKVPKIYDWIFQQAFEVREHWISSPLIHTKNCGRVCVDIFITVLYLELRVCAEENLYWGRALQQHEWSW